MGVLRHIGVEKVVFHKQSKVLSYTKLSEGTQKIILISYLISKHISNSECWTITLQMSNRNGNEKDKYIIEC